MARQMDQQQSRKYEVRLKMSKRERSTLFPVAVRNVGAHLLLPLYFFGKTDGPTAKEKKRGKIKDTKGEWSNLFPEVFS